MTSQYLYYTSAVNQTTLASSLANVGSPSVNSVTGFPSSYPFKLLIDWGLSTQEAILVTSAPTGTGPYTVPCIRGVDGTTAQVHSAGAQVVHGFSADELNILSSLVLCVTGSLFGAVGNGVTDCTAAIQNAINTAALTPGARVFFPAGAYRVSQLTLASGTILQGVSSGTYPGNNTIPGVSVLERLASTNLDLLLAPDGINYCRIFDLAIDGNKNNNTAGMGLKIADGAVGQESQFIIERCYFHDNPDSNIYLGHNRRANKVQYSTFLQSASGDGITVCGSDNLIMSCICGSNGRAGINLGSTVSQNWAAFGSNQNAVLTHVINCDVFKNNVGIALPSNASQALILGNGIDRNNLQGITVYDGDANVIIGNALHSNGQAADNTYAHIDVASGVGSVSLANNIFGPKDSGITNLCTTCVNIASWAGISIVSGNIGYADTISPDTHSGLINSQASTPAAVRLSNAGATIQGSGNDVLGLRNPSGTQLVKVTNGGALVCLQAGAQFAAAQNVMGSLTALTNSVLSLIGTATGTAQLKTQLFSGQTADIATFLAANGSTVLAKITAAGVYVGPQAATVSYKPADPTATTSTTLVVMGIGSTCVFTPAATGKVLVTVNGGWTTATAAINGLLSARYGTGTAPANGAADTGTRWGTGSTDMSVRAGSTAGKMPFSFTELLTLTVGTAYWFDLATSTASASDAATITNVVMTLQELPA